MIIGRVSCILDDLINVESSINSKIDFGIEGNIGTSED